MAELALEQPLELGDYLAAFRRRRGMVFLIAAMIFILGLITAFVWPPTYQATATILIEEQGIPAELVQSTVTSYAAQRIEVISQRVMTRSNLKGIMDKYGLYQDDRKRETIEVILDQMREDINIDMITADVMDPRTGRPAVATIAFTLGFKSEIPEQAQKVASELTTLYLNENLKTRTEKAAETYDFLTEEATRLEAEINRLEKQLTAFKVENAEQLPELQDLNIQAMQRTETRIENIDTEIRTLEESKIYLQGQLVLVDPYGASGLGMVPSPAARLDALNSEYTRLSARYSPGHPDVISTRREIDALEIQLGITGSGSADLAQQVDALKKELAVAEQSYSAEHPDVKSLKRQIATLEDELRNAAKTTAATGPIAAASNPAYISLQTQLEAANSQIRAQTAQRKRLLEKYTDYEQHLRGSRQVEGTYRIITRNLNNAVSRYQDTKAKQMMAQVGQQLEAERKGERFTLIEPAILPEEPISPNRPAIIFLSLVLALGSGIGTAAIRESMDSAVRGAKGLVALLNTAPLAVIPYLANEQDIRQQKKRRIIMTGSVIAAIVIVLLLVHFLFSPLDVLWFRGMRKVDNMVGG